MLLLMFALASFLLEPDLPKNPLKNCFLAIPLFMSNAPYVPLAGLIPESLDYALIVDCTSD